MSRGDMESQILADAKIKAAAEKLAEVLAGWQATGCPICRGDCAAANPPISACMMKATSDALDAYRNATEGAQ